MIKVPTINIDITPTQKRLTKELDQMKEDYQKDLEDLQNIVEAKKKKMKDTVENMKKLINSRKESLKAWQDEWSAHDTKWRINHSPELKRMVQVFEADINTMENSMKNYISSTTKDIEKFLNQKQKEIIQRSESMIALVQSEINGLASQARKSITDTIKSLIPPIKIPDDLLGS